MILDVGNKMQGLDIDDSMMDKTAAIIYSMTKEERANPKIIKLQEREESQQEQEFQSQKLTAYANRFRIRNR